jgi:hypothetical protein
LYTKKELFGFYTRLLELNYTPTEAQSLIRNAFFEVVKEMYNEKYSNFISENPELKGIYSDIS